MVIIPGRRHLTEDTANLVLGCLAAAASANPAMGDRIAWLMDTDHTHLPSPDTMTAHQLAALVCERGGTVTQSWSWKQWLALNARVSGANAPTAPTQRAKERIAQECPSAFTDIMTVHDPTEAPAQRLEHHTNVACSFLRYAPPDALTAAAAAMAEGMRRISTCDMMPVSPGSLLPVCDRLMDILPLQHDHAGHGTWMMRHLIERCDRDGRIDAIDNLVTKATQQRHGSVIAALYEQFGERRPDKALWTQRVMKLMIPHLTQRHHLDAMGSLPGLKRLCDARLTQLEHDDEHP
jgi:GNAT superfamily N-acetyltransferase